MQPGIYHSIHGSIILSNYDLTAKVITEQVKLAPIDTDVGYALAVRIGVMKHYIVVMPARWVLVFIM